MNQDSLLNKLVEIDSSFPYEEKIVTFLSKILKDYGFTIDFQEIDSSRKNIFAQKGKGDKAILFFGHLDTVPVIGKSEWKTDPFKLTKVGNKYYGLGASDMKGGIASFIEAVKDTNSYVKIFLSVDEENISEGAWAAVNQRKDFFSDVNLIISAEANFNDPLYGITTGRNGRCVYDVTFKGSAEHLMNYKSAVDAIEKLGRFISKLYDQRECMLNSPESILQVRKISGESIGMSVCAEASAEVEVLLGVGDTVESVQQILQQMTDAQIVKKPRKTPYLPAYKFESFPYQKEIARIIKENTGHEMKLSSSSSVGDDNVLATLGIPVITWGPCGGNEHRPNEFVDIKSLETTQKMYEELLRTVNS